MRKKTCCPRARLSKSPRKPSSTTASARWLPNLHPGEGNAEDGMDKIVPDSLSESDVGGGQDDRPGNSGNEPNVCGKKHRGLDCSDVDWLEGNACILCNGGGELLVCSDIGCPLAFHQKCMKCKPHLDGDGKFYCPFCRYRREVAKTKELRKKAMLAKKALSDFLDSKMVDDNNKKQTDGRGNENDPNVMPFFKERNCKISSRMAIDTEVQDQSLQGQENHQNDKHSAKLAECDQHKLGVEHQMDILPPVGDDSDGALHCQEGKTSGIDSLNDSISEEDMNDRNICKTHEMEILEDGEGMQEKCDGQVHGGQGEVRPEVKEWAEPANAHCMKAELTHWDKLDPTVLSTRGDAAQRMPEIHDSDDETITVRVKRRIKKEVHQIANAPKSLSPKPHTRLGEARNQSKKVNTSKNSRQPQDSAKNTNRTFASEKRKRLYWTPGEEEALKEGVHKFANTAKQMPWVKIMDFGRHVFDQTRTPQDLKDKWRNMLAKGLVNRSVS